MPASITEVKSPRPFSLSGPHAAVFVWHPRAPRAGKGGADDHVFALVAPLATTSFGNAKVTTRRALPSRFIATAPAPLALGPSHSWP